MTSDRVYFAGQALQGLLACSRIHGISPISVAVAAKTAAEWAFIFADEMLSASKQNTYKAAYDLWMDKTEWVQRESFPFPSLGMRRVDIMTCEILRLRAKCGEPTEGPSAALGRPSATPL